MWWRIIGWIVCVCCFVTSACLGLVVVVEIAQAQTAAPTTAPVGSLAADIISWTWAVAGPVLASIIGTYFFRLMQKEGYNLDEQKRFRVRQLIEHGLALGAAAVAQAAAKNPSLDVRSALVAAALAHVQKVGGTDLKALGFGLDYEKEKEALKALIAAELAAMHEEHPAAIVAAFPPKAPDSYSDTYYDPRKPLTPDPKGLLDEQKAPGDAQVTRVDPLATGKPA